MTRPSSPHDQHRRTIRVLAVVPGMREIGWAVGVRTRGGTTELTHWGIRNLPRGKTAFERIRLAQGWLDEEIRRLRVDEVRIVLPEPYHLTQAKNPTKLGVMVAALRFRAALIAQRSLVPRRSRIRIPPPHARTRLPRRLLRAWAALNKTLPCVPGRSSGSDSTNAAR